MGDWRTPRGAPKLRAPSKALGAEQVKPGSVELSAGAQAPLKRPPDPKVISSCAVDVFLLWIWPNAGEKPGCRAEGLRERQWGKENIVFYKRH